MDNNAMYNIGYGLYILTAKENEKDNGCILNTVMQVTTSPNQIMISVNKQNYTHDMIVRTGKFNLSVLTEETPFSIFERFGYQSGKNTDKFNGFEEVERSQNELTYLSKYVNSYISGKVISKIDVGSHTLFLSEVEDAKVLSKSESVTYSYYQSSIKPKPNKEVKKGYRCKVCGYIYEGDVLPEDFVCPICKHGASDFERI